MNLIRRLCWLVTAALVVVVTAGCPTAPPPAPRGSVTVPPSVPTIPYTIQTGDTLFSIARRHGVDWREILDVNPTLDPRDLNVGQTIYIPSGRAAPVTPGVETPVPPATRNPGHPGPIAAEGSFIWPMRGDVFSRFRQPMSWRMGELNQGIDIRASAGQVVIAAKSGRVNTFDSVPGYGKVVVLEHTDGCSSFYGHLGQILVTHGTWVKQGEAIGTAGTTGQSAGTELHFRIMQGDRLVDPSPLLR